MNSIFDNSDKLITALVQTMVHSLWQFSVIALVMSFLLHYYRDASAARRYNIALGSLLMALLMAGVTFLWHYGGGGPEATAPLAAANHTAPLYADGVLNSSWADRISVWIDTYRFPIFIAWLTGVLLFLLKFGLSLAYVENLSRTARQLQNEEVIQSFKKVCHDFGISTDISIGTSHLISTPMILGVIRPLVLLPIGMVNQLSPGETEAILVHELAHFVRKDIWINMAQTLIEALFYYHPAIWWISANIRVERESCCDELAITYTGDNVSYAKALVKVQEMYLNGNAPSLAMNFSSRNESFFSNRIKRILNMTQTRNFLREKILTTVMLVAIVMLFTKNMTGSSAPVINDEKQTIKKEITITVPDTIPARRESIRIQKRTNDKDVKIAIEDGKVTDLEVDGKKIDKKDYDKYQDLIDEMKPQSFGQGNARMFFFGDDNGKPFEFRYGHPSDMDSLFGQFKGLEGLGFGDDAFRENMKRLHEQLGRMKFNFDGLDNLNFNFDGLDSLKFNFGFPEGGRLHDGESLEDLMEDYDMVLPEGHAPADDRNFNEIIGNALNRDGLLIPNQENKVELTGKHLRINGEKQPTNIWLKYKRIFEQESGTVMQKNSRLEFKIMGKESKRKYRVY